MKILYRKTERAFEKFSTTAIRVLGNSVTFLFAVLLVILYFTDPEVYEQRRHETIMDIIFSITFLSIFIIQKSVNRSSVSLHVKLNELVAAHDKASNKMINVEEKTEEELIQLARHYSTIAEQVKSGVRKESSHSIESLLNEQEEDVKKLKGG